jgi:predicted RNase H-like HicB family nuclease
LCAYPRAAWQWRREVTTVRITIEIDFEEDGRWLAEAPELDGVMAYGATQEEALAKAEALALRVLADKLEYGEAAPMEISIAISA